MGLEKAFGTLAVSFCLCKYLGDVERQTKHTLYVLTQQIPLAQSVCSADLKKRDWQPCPVDAQSAGSDGDTKTQTRTHALVSYS